MLQLQPTAEGATVTRTNTVIQYPLNQLLHLPFDILTSDSSVNVLRTPFRFRTVSLLPFLLT